MYQNYPIHFWIFVSVYAQFVSKWSMFMLRWWSFLFEKKIQWQQILCISTDYKRLYSSCLKPQKCLFYIFTYPVDHLTELLVFSQGFAFLFSHLFVFLGMQWEYLMHNWFPHSFFDIDLPFNELEHFLMTSLWK